MKREYKIRQTRGRIPEGALAEFGRQGYARSSINSLCAFRPSWSLISTVTLTGIPTAVIQICLSVTSSLTNIAAYAFGAKNEQRFQRCVRFALKGSLVLTVLNELVHILLLPRFLGLTGIAITQQKAADRTNGTPLLCSVVAQSASRYVDST